MFIRKKSRFSDVPFFNSYARARQLFLDEVPLNNNPGGPTPPVNNAPAAPAAPGQMPPVPGSVSPTPPSNSPAADRDLQVRYEQAMRQLNELSQFKQNAEKLLGAKQNEFDANKFFERLAEDPRAALREALSEDLGSVQQAQLKMQIDGTLNNLRARYPDFKDFEQDMSAHVNSGAFTYTNPAALEILYRGLKAMKTDMNTGPKTTVPGVETPGSGAPGSSDFSPEQLNAMSLADIEKMVGRAQQ